MPAVPSILAIGLRFGYVPEIGMFTLDMGQHIPEEGLGHIGVSYPAILKEPSRIVISYGMAVKFLTENRIECPMFSLATHGFNILFSLKFFKNLVFGLKFNAYLLWQT